MTEYIRLRNMNDFDEWDSNEIEETNIDDEDETTNLLDDNDGEDSNFNGEGRTLMEVDNSDFEFNRYFNGNLHEARNIGFFMEDVMDKPREYQDPRFIKYLMDKHNFKCKKTLSVSGLITNYEIDYYGKPYTNEDGLEIRPARKYHVIGREFQTADEDLSGSESIQCSSDLDYLYDKWKDEVLKKKIKKAGLVGGVLIAIAGLVSGLSLGLKRSGHSMVHDSKEKWKKLTPVEKKQIVIPWTKLEEASGKSVILVGDYLYVLIGGAILVYALRE